MGLTLRKAYVKSDSIISFIYVIIVIVITIRDNKTGWHFEGRIIMTTFWREHYNYQLHQ